jgi:hypothetical protein
MRHATIKSPPRDFFYIICPHCYERSTAEINLYAWGEHVCCHCGGLFVTDIRDLFKGENNYYPATPEYLPDEVTECIFIQCNQVMAGIYFPENPPGFKDPVEDEFYKQEDIDMFLQIPKP